MTTSSPATEAPAAKRVRVTDEALIVELQDGRSVSVPLHWYPRLAEGRPSERRQWQLIGPGIGIHWPALDEDISVEGLLLGLPSGESAHRCSAGGSPGAAPLPRRVRRVDREDALRVRERCRPRSPLSQPRKKLVASPATNFNPGALPPDPLHALSRDSPPMTGT